MSYVKWSYHLEVQCFEDLHKTPSESVVFTEVHENIFAWESLIFYNMQQITEIKPVFISVIPENTDMAWRI